MPMPVYMKRYIWRIALFMLGYVAVLSAGLVLRNKGLLALPGKVALALLTAAMICGVFWTISRLLIECDDEYQRLLWIKQTLLATGAALGIATCWEFLRVYEVLAEGPQFYGVIWLACWGVAAPIVRLRA